MRRLLAALLLSLSCISAFAEEEAGKVAETVAYYGFEPDITTNYIKQPGARTLGYVRVSVELMVGRASDVEIVEKHAPLLRDAIISILGAQDEDMVRSLEGREEIRRACLRRVNELLVQETGDKRIADVLFTKYLYQ